LSKEVKGSGRGSKRRDERQKTWGIKGRDGPGGKEPSRPKKEDWWLISHADKALVGGKKEIVT